MKFSNKRSSYYYGCIWIICNVALVLADYFVKSHSPTFGTVVKTVRADSLHTCMHKCSRHPLTDSVIYDKNKKTCQLLMTHSGGDSLVQFINKYNFASKVNAYIIARNIVLIQYLITPGHFQKCQCCQYNSNYRHATQNISRNY